MANKKDCEICENCKWWKCMGYHYYECTNPESERYEEGCSRGSSCERFEE
ncbi:MAG: hypothetical protein IKX61_01370 [Prevotella sp.]|nr:hypothetical protein [Prevotella sp.]